MSSSTSGRDLSDPFLAFAFHLRSSPLSPDWLGLFALEWHPAGEPDYAQVVLAAREVALLYRGQALVFPQQDRSPPRLWLVAPEDLELAPPADLNLDLDATSGASGDPCRTQAFLQTQAPRQDDRGKKVRPLRERLAALGLRLVKKFLRVDPEIFENALRFSLEARISPLWNRVGPFLLEGRLFLFQRSVAALEPRIYLDTGDFTLRMVLRAGQVRSPGLSLDDFGINPRVKGKFEERVVDVVPGRYIGLSSVCVLPRLTRATVVSVTREMIHSNRIKSWKDMRRYWKNMYGFRLQQDEKAEGEEEQPPFYVNVTFDFGSSNRSHQVFSYPGWCVRQDEPRPVPRVDPTPIVEKFLKDLTSKFSSICEQQLSFFREPPSNRHQSQAVGPSGAAARSAATPAAVVGRSLPPVRPPPPIPLKAPELEGSTWRAPPASAATKHLTTSLTVADDVSVMSDVHNSQGVIVGAAVTRETEGPDGQGDFEILAGIADCEANDDDVDAGGNSSFFAPSDNVFASCFDPFNAARRNGRGDDDEWVREKERQQQQQQQQQCRPVVPKFVPTFRPIRPKTFTTSASQASPPPPAPPRVVPSFKPHRPPPPPPPPASSLTPAALTSGPREGSFLSRALQGRSSSVAGRSMMATVPMERTNEAPSAPASQTGSQSPSNLSEVVRKVAVRKVSTPGTTAGDGVSPSGPKRSRPSAPTPVSTDAEVEAAAREGKLRAINVAGLYSFLKRHNVPCRKKDKKEDLLRKVSALLSDNEQ